MHAVCMAPINCMCRKEQDLILGMPEFWRCEMPRAKGLVQKCVIVFVFLGLLCVSWRAISSGERSQKLNFGRGMLETHSSSPASYMRSVKFASGPERGREVCRGTFNISRFPGHGNNGAEYWLQQPVHRKLQRDRLFKPLTPEQVQGVEKFLFFTGYPRSGHSIVGSFLDAHPNITLSFAFFLFRNLLKRAYVDGNLDGLLRNKSLFFNILYEKSYHYSLVSRSKNRKGYTLDVPDLWSGRFNSQLKVIGDKSALPTTLGYSNSSPAYFKERYDCLQSSVGIPMLGIHVVRNPFDMISTHLLYSTFNYSWKGEDKEKWFTKNKYRNDSKLESIIDFFFDKANSVQEMIPLCGMNILEVHNEDLVKDPRKELQRMCKFLDVGCPEGYLQKCENKSYRNVSRSRDKVFWPPHLRQVVEERINRYSFFRGYSFEADHYNPIRL